MKEGVYRSTEEMIAALRPSYPVYCVRPSVLRSAAAAFCAGFPGDVLYAVKCNPHPLILKSIHAGGVHHFDTASLSEVALVHEMFPDARLYFNHPIKVRPHIRMAYTVYGVRHYVIDHDSELDKVRQETGDAKDTTILVRMATPAAGAAFHLSAKFGAPPDRCVELLQAVRDAGLTPALAFHVGSQCINPQAYTMALRVVRDVLNTAQVELAALDVGGGFPAAYTDTRIPPLSKFFTAIKRGLKELNLPKSCAILAEPGRALVADGVSLVVQVLQRKEERLYINDGVYHSLSETVSGGIRLPPRLIRLDGQPPSNEMADYTLYGPTCDSTDVLPHPYALPADVREGDWIELGRAGAYSSALVSHFNGFHPETFIVIDESVA
ncbi:MAG: type III PLP-dependent enzyme [Alphaproteobacteria bacterium]